MAVMVPMMLAIAAQGLTNGPTAPATSPPGTIGVHLIDEPADRRVSDQPFVDAVSHALAAANFVPLDAGHGRYHAEVTVTRRATGRWHRTPKSRRLPSARGIGPSIWVSICLRGKLRCAD